MTEDLDKFDLNAVGLGKKEIVCSRCGKHKLVNSNWKWSECEYCHSRPHSVRSGKKSMKQAEEEITTKVVKQLKDFEGAYREHKQVAREMKQKPMSKKAFYDKIWLSSHQAKVEQIKRTVDRYSKDIPLNPNSMIDCLHFRYLFEKRNQLAYDPCEDDKDFQCLYWHHTKCEECLRWYQIHKDDALVIPSTSPQADDEYCSQKEFEDSITALFKELRGESEDPLEQAERKAHPNLRKRPDLDRMMRQDLGLEKPDEPQIDSQRQILEQAQQDDFYARQQLEREQEQLAQEEIDRILKEKQKTKEWLESNEEQEA